MKIIARARLVLSVAGSIVLASDLASSVFRSAVTASISCLIVATSGTAGISRIPMIGEGAGSTPLAPDRLEAAAVSTSAINLTWRDNSDDESGLDIERSANGSDFYHVTLAPENTTAYLDSGLREGTTYYYRIKSFNAAGYSAYSNVSSATTDFVEINGSLKGQPGNIQDNVFQSLCIDPQDENVVYVGTETNGIFKTADGGGTWARLRKGLKLDPNRMGYPQIYEIAVAPQNSQVLYAATIAAPGPLTGGTEALRSNYAGVYKSVDGGNRWAQKVSGFFNTYTPHVVVDPLDSRTLFAGIGGAKSMDVFYEGGILVSHDAGESWQRITPAEGTTYNTPISMKLTAKGSSRTLYVSYMVHGEDYPRAYGLCKSTDSGRTWSVVNPGAVKWSFREKTWSLPIQYFDVFEADDVVLYANDGQIKRLFKSGDGGETWTPTGLGNYGPVKISPVDSRVVFYTGYTTLFKSVDGLKTSRMVLDDTSRLGTRQFMDIKISKSNPEVVWAAAKGYYLYKSTDGGEHFARITAVRDLVYGPGN